MLTNQKRHLGVVTAARSDFGCLQGLCRSLWDDPEVDLTIFATGMHFSEVHGNTIDEIRGMGFGDALVELPNDQIDDSPASIGAAMAVGVARFTEALSSRRPDILVMMGDRYDALPAAVAAMPFNIPFAHLSGGEVTEGQIDEMIRHAITQMSHLHFPDHEDYKNRLIRMGVEPWRVFNVGHVSLDGIDDLPFLTRDELFGELGLETSKKVSVFTYHPETLNHEGAGNAINLILRVAERMDSQILFTYPNSDTGNQPIIDAIDAFCSRRSTAVAHKSLGRTRYFNLLREADCMVGNSSSGVIDAASFQLPVVEIGARQRGRVKPPNIICINLSEAEIETAWRKALSREFQESLKDMTNPFQTGNAVQQIVDVLKSVKIDQSLITKQFFDGP